MPTDLCRVCDHPREGHGRRYAALTGLHEWVPDDMPRLDEVPTATGVRWCPCGPGETCAWCAPPVTEEREWTPEMGHPLPPARDIDRECTDTDPCGYCKPAGGPNYGRSRA
jgi:hypothetical protein